MLVKLLAARRPSGARGERWSLLEWLLSGRWASNWNLVPLTGASEDWPGMSVCGQVVRIIDRRTQQRPLMPGRDNRNHPGPPARNPGSPASRKTKSTVVTGPRRPGLAPAAPRSPIGAVFPFFFLSISMGAWHDARRRCTSTKTCSLRPRSRRPVHTSTSIRFSKKRCGAT